MRKQIKFDEQFLQTLENRLIALDKDYKSLSPIAQYTVLEGRCRHVIKSDLLKSRLATSKQEGKPLRVKYGVDPTSTELHLGHIAPLIVARRLLRMGHEIIVVLGDFTAMVGDPSGRVKTRPVLTPDQIKSNVSSYKEQIGRFIDIDKITFVYNSTFYVNTSVTSLLQMYRKVRVGPLLQRDDFRKRMDGLTIAEALYPTLMAIDSVNLKPDIELGGDDQLLNLNIANEFLVAEGYPEQSALTTDLLMGTSGNGVKMSKSENNYISLTETPADAFGKVMSIPDELMEQYFKLLTDISDEEWDFLSTRMVEGLNPSHVKKLLARITVSFLYDEQTAASEQMKFEKVFSEKLIPNEIEEFCLASDGNITTQVDLLTATNLAASRSEARRLVQSGAVRMIRGDKLIRLDDASAPLPNWDSWILNVGKRRYRRIVRA